MTYVAMIILVLLFAASPNLETFLGMGLLVGLVVGCISVLPLLLQVVFGAL